jgi:O-antigen ligase
MNFDLLTGLIISNPLFSFILLIIWWILLKKNFEFCLSLLVVGSFIIEYTEINLIVWTGTLLLPLALMIFLFIAPRFFNILNNFDSFTKGMVILITTYFFLLFVRGFFMSNDPVIIATNLLFDYTRIFLPFYGILIILKKNGSLLKHIKYNAYLSLLICSCYLIIIFSSSFLLDINSIRQIMFWNMPIGAFSGVALWSLFYFLSRLLLESKSKRLFLYLGVLLPIAVIFLSQSRGLLPSIIIGLFMILLLSKNKIKKLLPFLIGIFILFLIANTVNLNISNEDVSITEIYLERFTNSSNKNLITDDSRFGLWKNAIESIFSHPFGGANIDSEIGVHNYYLEILMQFGMFGLLYMIILFLYLKYLVKITFFIKRLDNKNLFIIAGTTLAIFSHALVVGLLANVDTVFYWSIAVLLCLRKEIIKSVKLQKTLA